MKRLFACWVLAVCSLTCLAETPAPTVKSVTVSNGVKTVTFTPAPAIEAYILRSGTNLAFPFLNDNSGVLSGTAFRVTNTQPIQFYGVGATPMSSNDVLSVNLLNRIAYGPTPDELVRVKAMGPQAFIDEQLAPEAIVEPTEPYTSQITNGVPTPAAPQWQFLSYTGLFTSSNLYAYLTAPGEAYIDDISLKPVLTVITTNINQTSTNYVTNFVEGAEAIVDGDFENPASLSVVPGLGRWVKTANMANSALSTAYAHSGSHSLQMVASQAGTTEGNSIYQRLTNLTFNFNAGTQRGVLSFWYLPTATSRNIKLRLSGSGVNGSGNNEPPAAEWIYATATGTATATRTIYIYLSGNGEAYIDDIKLVPGTVPEVGPNLIRNGDFESPLHTNNWNPTANFTRSRIGTNISHSGNSSLKAIATAAGSGSANAVIQTNIFVTNAQTYTVSFWYLHPTRGRTLTVRLSGADPGNAGLQAIEPNGTSDSLRRTFDQIQYGSVEDGTETANTVGGAALADLRAYHVLNAVSAKRQLVEVLLQFLENHFVTQHAKSVDYFDRFYDDSTLMDIFATDWEYRERSKWRAKLLDPNCNFYDLLKIHVESPAEIVYLDSVDSKGNAANVANENYGREILELFCMGVDNGYDQQDIIALSRAWTGWSVDIVDPQHIDNPFATRTERLGFFPGNGSSAVSNLVGVWTFNYKSASHGTNRAPIWSLWDPASPATNPQPIKIGGVPQSKTVPARFGMPWAGTPYALTIPPNRSGTNGILDGYDVTAKIANLPFTMEYISVKLCRWFVHEGFPNPNTFAGSPEYNFYDYTNPNRSAEAELVRQCMVAWDTPVNGRKGNIRSVLNVIFNSELFRTHSGSLQKVKTPVEFAVSAIRALSSSNSAGGPTARTDGYSISGRSRTSSSAPLTRMGGMMLFDRDSPDGYPEAGSPWISSGTLAERIRFIQTTLMATTDANKNDGISGGNFNITDPVGLLKAKLTSGNWNNAGAVADLFLSFLYPAEGKANLDEYRTLAISFLNTNDAGSGPSDFSVLTNPTNYDTRVRAMVSMLMTLPRFQEQ
ncbi:MAG TPA: DUF1800 family protein [Candidatus Limnocylindria bacterium]|nr:DUF1800 family protein [Candidatus Limnocylindria bacterium]